MKCSVCRVLNGPVLVGHAMEREVVALVGQTEVLGALEIVEHAEGVSECCDEYQRQQPTARHACADAEWSPTLWDSDFV